MMERKATFNDLGRMCKPRMCEDCPMNEMRNKYEKTCFGVLVEAPDEASNVVMKWIDEHPVKTYKQDFLEKFPNAAKYESGTLKACRKNVYGECVCKGVYKCNECWDEEMPE